MLKKIIDDMFCNHCHRPVRDGQEYYELKVTAKFLNFPIPYFFFYCSEDCITKDTSVEIKTRPSYEGDAE